jgi:hypothetical protein
VLYVKFYIFVFLYGKCQFDVLMMLLVRVLNVLRLVFVHGNVILRNVLRKIRDRLHIRGTWNIRVTNIFLLVL